MRSVTDEQVLRALLAERRLTRAELAARTGISKPTAGESMRRLAERGLVIDTGDRTQGGRGRGRVGSYYSLAPNVGSALAIGIAPEGVIAECVDAHGDTAGRAHTAIDRPALPERVAAAVRRTVAKASSMATPRLAVVGAADPVDRVTGRLVQLPDSPFLVGELDLVGILTPLVDGPVITDNDVNWAARAERDASAGNATGDFAYLYLDEGLGCAILSNGEVLRGATGLAGEIEHLITEGPDGRAIALVDVFARLGLHQRDSTAIDVGALRAECASSAATRDALGRALAGVVAAAIGLADPRQIVIGGSWGPGIVETVRATLVGKPRQTEIRAATVTSDPVFTGVRAEALRRLQAAIASAGRQPADLA